MTDLQKAVKMSLITGFIGAAVLPILHETYANISKNFVIFCLLAGCVVSGILYSKREVKNALCTITVQISISAALGIALYVLIHPLTVSFLNKISKYFYLSSPDSFYYYSLVLLNLLGIYFIYAIAHMIVMLIKRTKDSNEKIKSYIDNAFDD